MYKYLILAVLVISPTLSAVTTENAHNGKNRVLSEHQIVTRSRRQSDSSTTSEGRCVLPPAPEHGHYTVTGISSPKPGDVYDAALVNVTCDPGYGLKGGSNRYCISGIWSEEMPKCLSICKLPKNPNIEYRCVDTGISEGARECQEEELSGTRVMPRCKPPYRSPGDLTAMTCIAGSWDYSPRCVAECGIVTPSGQELIIGGRRGDRGEMPWHAGIYKKTTDPYTQICGGSLISTNVVISAAHCFWLEAIEPASNYAVAVGKLYRPWSDARDDTAQTSDITAIKIPNRFHGAATHFSPDIAILQLATPVKYSAFVRPVCIDFDLTFNKKQLEAGNIGKLAGWGITAEDMPSPLLKVYSLTVLGFPDCFSSAPPHFRPYITSDKICATYANGSSQLRGTSGGGLVFPLMDKGVQRYYLRGVLSTAPVGDNVNTLTIFTEIAKQEDFIKLYI